MSDGEIAFLDADNLDEHRELVAVEEADSYDLYEGRAIGALRSMLAGSKQLRGASDEELRDRAEQLYALLCRQATAKGASPEQVAQLARLTGEDPQSMLARLGS